MVPPWRSTIFLQMASPMPVPGYFCGCAGAGRSGRSARNTAARCRCRCRAPRRPSAPFLRRAPTWICGGGSLRNLMALPMRFWKSCVIWVASTGRVGNGSLVTVAPGGRDAGLQVAQSVAAEAPFRSAGAKAPPRVPTREKASRSVMSRSMRWRPRRRRRCTPAPWHPAFPGSGAGGA